VKYYCIQYLQLQWLATENRSLRLSLTLAPDDVRDAAAYSGAFP